MIQDIFPHKLDNAYKNLTPEENDFVVVFRDKSVAVEKISEDNYRFPKYSEMKSSVKNNDLRYLFSVDNAAFFLYSTNTNDELAAEVNFLPLKYVRKMKYAGFKEMYFLICTAWHLHSWYMDNIYCGSCCGRLMHGENERVLICPDCGRNIYPRISPAVIIGVTNGDKIIMSKYAGRAYKGYALLSGFVEIGETLEQAVAREVMEEAGIKVKNIRYYKSQPGGIDGNILAGFFCELDGSDSLTVDENELEFAAWFKREDIPVEDDGFSLTYEMIGVFKSREAPTGKTATPDEPATPNEIRTPTF